jgi:hypothetical protein
MGTTMNADYFDAHERHWDDAERLFTAQRWANADHLYGMAAECGLKRLMLAFGMDFDAVGDKPATSADRVHADGVWARYESYRSGHPQGARYGLPATNPFNDWQVSQRYAHQAYFTEARAGQHRTGADLVNGLVISALVEGVL